VESYDSFSSSIIDHPKYTHYKLRVNKFASFLFLKQYFKLVIHKKSIEIFVGTIGITWLIIMW